MPPVRRVSSKMITTADAYFFSSKNLIPPYCWITPARFCLQQKIPLHSLSVQRANHRGTTFVRMCSHTSFPITQGQAEMTTFWNLFRLSHHLSSEATFCLSVTKPSSSLWMTLSEVGASILLFFLAFPIYGTKFRWKQRLCQGVGDLTFLKLYSAHTINNDYSIKNYCH